MQQSTHRPTPMPQNPPSNITTEQIQKYLDENKQLILAILDNQNLGKLAECAQYQALLQKNLLFLAAVADAQPQGPAVRSQGVMQQGHYMQQSPIFAPRAAFNPSLQQQQQQPQLLPFQGHMGMRPVGVNGMHIGGASHGPNGHLPQGTNMAEFPSGGPPVGSGDPRRSKQDSGSDTSESADASASIVNGHGSGGGDPTPSKRLEDSKVG